MDDNKSKAIAIFLKNMPNYKMDHILEIKLLTEGFSNVCYYFQTNDLKEFFVRIGSTKINRLHEYLFLKAFDKLKDYYFYDQNNGDAIRIWYKGECGTFETCRNPIVFENIIKQIKKIQEIKLSQVSQMQVRDFYVFLDICEIEKIYIDEYKKILTQYKDLPLVVSHNDIRPSNIIINNNDAFIIDYEWCTLNNQYWDLANTARELEFPLDQLEKLFKFYFPNLDFSVFLKMLFATTCFAVQWTFFETANDALLKYRKNAIRVMQNYFDLIKKLN
ncbi:MAG: phosphotransferase [Malacoplasma sp.]|nr:phosphotransferase [Malacoplasma sp.]